MSEVQKITTGLTPVRRNARPRMPQDVAEVIEWHRTVCRGEGKCGKPTEHNLAATIIHGPYHYPDRRLRYPSNPEVWRGDSEAGPF